MKQMKMKNLKNVYDQLPKIDAVYSDDEVTKNYVKNIIRNTAVTRE